MCKAVNFLCGGGGCNRETEIETELEWDKYNPQFFISVSSLLIPAFPAHQNKVLPLLWPASCFDLLLKLSVVFNVVNRCLLLRRLSWAGSQDKICIPLTSLVPHEFLPCLPDLLAYGTQASVLGRLFFFDLHLFPLWISLYCRNWNTFSSCWLPNLYLQLALLQWTQPYCVFSYLTFLFVCYMGIPTSKCPELRSHHFTPSVHQLLPLSLPHFDKWHCCSSSSGQRSWSPLSLTSRSNPSASPTSFSKNYPEPNHCSATIVRPSLVYATVISCWD